ncbi:UNVERIFIED_CONTAM: Hydroquinone glucosyltransferase [Sesamum latifolium]|uniref:Hydroquinone glucosyltransferase n=1 Tax=Sesamum latifolium TaxID=2727402 RepID=A0AAW2XSS5_9LAMI
METSHHIAILPSPGMGHLIPLAELAKNLISRHSFSVTFIIPTDANTSHLQAQKSFLQALPHSISCIFLPPISFTDHLPTTQRSNHEYRSASTDQSHIFVGHSSLRPCG